MTRNLAALILCLMPFAVMAKAPATSARPELRPELRPDVAPTVRVMADAAVGLSPRPGQRPRNLIRHVHVQATDLPAAPTKPVATSSQGSVCGDPSIRGQKLATIPGRLRGCGIKNPVKVTSVDGVTLSQPATLNCDAAKALDTWVSRSVKPAVGQLGGGVRSLRVIAHYSCRTRNNLPGAKVSEHGRGNAIDVAAINLNNGSSIDVRNGWRDRSQSKILKRIHAGACGTFKTVLGPDSDQFHQDHFHLDVARRGGSAYCR